MHWTVVNALIKVQTVSVCEMLSRKWEIYTILFFQGSGASWRKAVRVVERSGKAIGKGTVSISAKDQPQ